MPVLMMLMIVRMTMFMPVVVMFTIVVMALFMPVVVMVVVLMSVMVRMFVVIAFNSLLARSTSASTTHMVISLQDIIDNVIVYLLARP